MTYYEVKPGQIWADNDKRCAGRTLRVDAIEGGKAVCLILTNSDETQEIVDARSAAGYPTTDRRGKITQISLSRFKPTNTGYRLVKDHQYGIRWDAGSVFSYSSREAAEAALAADGRGIGTLVVHDIEPGTPNASEWREVEA
jgi:hypothetical protein